MKPCGKVDNCAKIEILLDKDAPDFMLADAIREVCSSCVNFEDEEKKTEWTFKLKVAEVAAKFPNPVTLDEALELLKIEATDVEEVV